MRPSLAFETHRRAIREIVKKYPTVNPRVFGSVLHGTDHEESDLDVLVDALPGATLLDLGDLEADLVQALGTRVEVLTPQDLPHKFRERVLAEAQPV
ncbi:nucleotidyltransferase [Rothia sp. HMSC058E10]|jgi:DNA polymerase beta subunit|uniref:Nucleotidyltransferase n=2 Tax=Rothia dentocariosa TaxID=2047 RepID=A0A2A8D5I9_9MICC|nr:MULTISPECIES: nucleotidyltransferase [Rothia]ADP40711.1 nucleotidyltransferase domain protein [Rothia dentocariosa ATCC 17931]OFN15054.1 nucleotidyltransferase [Rothia sp. HMSC058E10]OFN47357.1 nucleotidyltransferase [Rothia sp. HMSC071F11]OFO74548.1 nucleotidyltransferase [Rothia sp. HMSC065D02]OFQ05901.1 nucleotidyltransferase [Rothia sp. HMSC036D11]